MTIIILKRILRIESDEKLHEWIDNDEKNEFNHDNGVGQDGRAELLL